jgi:poly(3-hydroxybutyrate) depolymerase
MLPAAQRNEMKEMRSVTSTVVLVGLTAGLASVYGCTVSADDPGNPFTMPMAGSGGGGTVFPGAGTTGSNAGSATAGGSAMAGSATGGSAPTAGSGTGGATTGGQSTAGASGTGTGGGSVGGGAITKVWKSDGCGKAFAGQSGAKVTIQTMGTKPDMCPNADPTKCCADKLGGMDTCGPYTVTREYYVYMPANYDMNKAYPLILEGPGCGGSGIPSNIYPLPDIANQSIRIGLTPPPNSIGHGTNENQGCFDDKEGDDSVDWVYYENFYDKLNAEVCFDRNRVFSAGNSSGSWFSNELGCKYAGDATRPVRGVLPNTGGLPNEPQFVPTCTTKPMAGMWVHEINDSTNGFAGNKVAIDRAIKVNGCTGAMSYDAKVTANEIQDFPIGGNNPAATCKLLKGCPEIHPLVVCALPGNQHGGHDSVVNPGFATFVKQFSAGNFLTQ